MCWRLGLLHCAVHFRCESFLTGCGACGACGAVGGVWRGRAIWKALLRLAGEKPFVLFKHPGSKSLQVTPSHSSLEPRLEIIRLEYIPIQLFGLQSNAWLLHESPADTSIMSYGSYGTGCRWHAVGTRMHSQGTMMAVVAYTIWLGIDAASQTTKLDGIHRIPTDLRMWSVFSAFFQARVTRSTKDWNPVHSLHDSEPDSK